MRSLHRLAVACALAAVALWPAAARAVPVDFSAGSWIIPMDACNQPSAPQQCSDPTPAGTCRAQPFSGNGWPADFRTAADGRILSNFYPNGTCPEPLTQTPAYDGITKAYGLIYRLLQHGVPVYYVVQTNTDTTHPPYKTAINATDLTVTAPNGNPVQLLNHTPGSGAFGTSVNFMTAGHNSIDYRGAPFVIAAGDVARYNVANLLKTDSLMSASDPRTGRGVFQDVYIHVAQVNILQAPVRALLNATPPKLALLGVGGAGITNLIGYLMDAGLYTSSAVASYPTIGDVFTEFLSASDVINDGLISGAFKLLWAPHWDASAMTLGQSDGVLQAMSRFNAQGGTVLLQCASIGSAEGINSPLGNVTGSASGHFLTTTAGTNTGLNANVIPYYADTSIHAVYPSGVTGEGFAVNPTASSSLWSEPLVQVGDFPLVYDNRQAAVFDFVPTGSYKATVERLVSTMAPGSEAAYQNRDIFARSPAKNGAGQFVYIGGHTLSSVFSGCNAYQCAAMSSWQCANFAPGAQCAPNNGNCCDYGSPGTMPGLERLVLNSIIFLGQVPTATERTRSSPVVYSDGKTYLGSYLQQTQPAAAYPPWSGHFREYPASGLVGTNVTAFNQVQVIDWDAATHVATQANADSRTIFTAIAVSGKLTQTAFTAANAAVLGIPAATISAIRKGVLGGIDHSVPAIIGPSAVAGSATRPTVAYVGALDGMLHAILVSGTVAGKNPGDELWAYIPNSQLSKVVAQTAGVDGSPSVGDAFVDNGAGIKSWRTVLAIADGNYSGGTLDAIDVTDPVNPAFLWQASDSFTIANKTYVMGRAQGAGIAPILTQANGVQYAYFFATDNTTGTAGNAFNLYAIDAGTGAVIWRFNHLYANDTTHNDVPGTAAAIDSTGQSGTADTVYFGDLEGKVWAVPAATGAPSSPAPIYDAALANSQAGSVNFPIESAVVLYRDPGNQHLDVLGVTGGADWVPPATLSYVFSYDTVTKTGATMTTLNAGERAYAAPTIFGNQAYLLTSAGSIQGTTGGNFTATGYLLRVNLGASAGVTRLATITEGASEVWVDQSSNVVAASTTGITQNGNPNADNSQSVISLQNNPRPFTIQAWIDLH